MAENVLGGRKTGYINCRDGLAGGPCEALETRIEKIRRALSSCPSRRSLFALTKACLLGDRSGSDWDGETGSLELYHPLYPASPPEAPQPRDLALVLCITDEMERRGLRDDRNQRARLGQSGLSAFTCE